MNKHIMFGLSLLAMSASSAAANSTEQGQSISKGAYLATAGDCVACHSIAGSKPFTGGLRMSTPVGDIFSTNITPDEQTGIGKYTYDDFAKALREGVAKDGHHLYPAMPYTAFSKVNDEDMHALYEYFMHEVKPVRQENRESEIPWPLNMRWPLAMWNIMFHEDTVFKPDTSKSEEWNRGAYLVQGLEHCGTCHTPRGIAFQEKALDQSHPAFLTGGVLEGWNAPNLTGNLADGLGRWKQEEIVEFLKTGRTDSTAAFGSMAEAIEHSTQHLTNEDLNAMAVYLKSLKPSNPETKAPSDLDSTTQALVKGDMHQPGAQEYMDNCAACHRIDGKGYAKTFPALAHNSMLLNENPSSVVSIILRGGSVPVTKEAVTGLTMPDFAWRLDDQQVADLSTFIRNSWGNKAPAVTAKEVKALRAEIPVVAEKK